MDAAPAIVLATLATRDVSNVAASPMGMGNTVLAVETLRALDVKTEPCRHSCHHWNSLIPRRGTASALEAWS